MDESWIERAEAFYAVPERKRPRRREGFVYFVQQGGKGGPIKIGWTVNPRKRLSALRTGTTEALEMIHVEWTNKRREAELHERFAEYRIHGEWFRPAPEILAEAGIDPTD